MAPVFMAVSTKIFVIRSSVWPKFLVGSKMLRAICDRVFGMSSK